MCRLVCMWLGFTCFANQLSLAIKAAVTPAAGSIHSRSFTLKRVGAVQNSFWSSAKCLRNGVSRRFSGSSPVGNLSLCSDFGAEGTGVLPAEDGAEGGMACAQTCELNARIVENMRAEPASRYFIS